MSENDAQEKYNNEWIEASYKTLGWEKPLLLSDKDFEAIDIACGMRETSLKKPNPTWFYEKQIVQAILAKLASLSNEQMVDALAEWEWNYTQEGWIRDNPSGGNNPKAFKWENLSESNKEPVRDWARECLSFLQPYISGKLAEAVAAKSTKWVAEVVKQERERIFDWLRNSPKQGYKLMKRAKMGGYENLLEKDWQALQE